MSESEVLGATSGLVYVIEGRVALDTSLGRLEFPPDVADSVAAAFRRAARMIREGRAREGQKVL